MPHVIDVTDPYDPRGPTISPDGRTAFTTLAYDSDKIAAPEFDAAEAATEVARDAGVQVEYDGTWASRRATRSPAAR